MTLSQLAIWFSDPPSEETVSRESAPRLTDLAVDSLPALSSPDTALIARLSANDEAVASAALGELHAAWAAPLARYAERLLRAPDAADDVVQDIFLALWDRRPTLPRQGSLRAYLFGAVHRRALQRLRHDRVAARWADTVAEQMVTSWQAASPPPTTYLEAHELAHVLRTAVAALPPRQREALLLYRERELTLADVAHVMGISINTVKVQLQRASATLRRAVEDYLAP